jgi:MoaA/NifB/PqqE/SkfB family radical SAM enzyme
MTVIDGRAQLSARDFALSSVDLYITSRCNRRCTYCFLSDDLLSSRTIMSVATIRSVIEWADASSIEEFTLLGGEPALHPSFAEIVTHLAGTRFRVRTVTNGSKAFRKELGKPEVAAALSRVAVSLDAPAAGSVDRLRGRGAWEDAMRTIDLLTGLGRPLDINFTVLRSNIDIVPEMIAFVEEIGARRLNMHWFSLVGRARKHASDEQVTASEWRTKVLEVVRDYHVGRRVKGVRDDYVVDCETAFGFPGYASDQLDRCAVRDRTNLQFFPSGSVYSCGMVVEDDNFSGYLWSDAAGLTRRPSEISELTGASRRPACGGCPMRESYEEYPPLCIYSRMEL